MPKNLPESTRLAYARQLADEAKTLVPGMERLSEIAAELRADDLFRLLGFDTWERFCTDYLGVSKRTANRWIAGPSKVAAVSASDTQRPKSIGAGQRVAAGQNVPIVESDTLKSPAASTEAPASSSEGGGQDGETRPAPEVPAPSGKSSDGGEDAGNAPGIDSPSPLSDPPDPEEIIERDIGGTMIRGPRKYIDECKLIPLGDGASLLPNNGTLTLPTERPPTDRALTSRVFAAMREVDPTDAGPVTTPEEATFLRQWAQRTLDAWKAIYAPPAPAEKPQRRQGTITVPAERLNGTVGRPSTRVTIPSIPAPKLAKRHADDCSCLSCVPPKVAAK